MTHPVVALIAAHDLRRGIGFKGEIPWQLSADMKHFRELTTGHPIIMGRKTHESIGRALPNRTNIVITRQSGYQAADCLVVGGLEEALDVASQQESGEVFVIGGGEIYRQALPIADKLYLTVVQREYAADAFFPEYAGFGELVSSQQGEEGGVRFVFEEWDRLPS